MESTSNIAVVFASFQEYINHDQGLREEIRTAVRDLEQTTREIHTNLQMVHQPGGIQNVPAICEKIKPSFETVKGQWKVLADKIPLNQYYRFHDHWKFVMQRLAFLASYLTYLQSEKMITREETASLIGVRANREEGFHIDLDDYLLGLLQMASELSRLAVNSVTAGDYGRPIRIARFVSEMDSGFRLLNLKNDSLRKRFDGLKYDMKKVEEVVYDLSIRGLKPKEEPQSI